MSTHGNLIGPSPTLLAVDPVADLLGSDPSPERARELVAAHPSSSLAWATLAEQALDDGRDVEGYAYARVGYHRGLDQLRKSGWRGAGPVPWSHEPNRGFLRCVTELAKAAEAIGEVDEQMRCTQLLRDCDPSLAP